ncbi:MAG: Asp-tRNA(Asn)/Glu-tRNA(Gln) amidotransferase subunit GatB [Desulfurococcales archaeon]|nr:Asp-tRNA(Asn)/Glu-tRNA(Gln) amidotransferase subunit GatB [Desulfurococcales archaeon]
MIGLEIHVQLTEAGTKLFCGCKSNYRGLPANTNVCPVCLGQPGALPVPQEGPVVYAVAASLQLGCRLPPAVVFTRKHYFYPDLPKNYQITEYEGAHGAPVCLGGTFKYLDPAGWEWRSVRIRRINLEEDPGRSSYLRGGILGSPVVMVDYNRSGVPLLEIVTEPDLRGPRDARAMVEYLLLTLEYLGAVNPRLEGAFRVDANISVPGGERVEVKNIGSTLDVERAIRYELLRQGKIVEHGGRVERETRHWDSARGVTRPLRHKEEEEEYLYIPDPDLPPVPIGGALLAKARRLLALTPGEVLATLEEDGATREQAWSIASTPSIARLYLETRGHAADKRLLARLLGVDLKGALQRAGRDPYSPGSLPPPTTITRLVAMVEKGEIPYDTVKGLILPRLAVNPSASLEELLPEKARVDESLILEVLAAERGAVCDYLDGEEKALNYLVGRVIRRLGRRAVDPRRLRSLIARLIEERGASICGMEGRD